jgi:hypothetical protein
VNEDATNDVREIKRNGISVRIRPTVKDGTTRFVVDYRANGQRKLVWRSTMADARKAADNAIDKITEGQAEVLNLKSADAHAFTRARAALEGIEKGIDDAAKEYAEAYRLLNGAASVLEACRDWAKRHAVTLPRITVADAVAEFQQQCVADGKSVVRRKEISTILTNFAEFFNVEIHTVEPKMIADYLTALALAERTKRNYRNVIGFFNRWLVLRGYLAKRTDWLEGVQNYSMRQRGEITTFTADEMRRLIGAADDRILPLIIIGGFAGLRHAEIARLDWQEIDLVDGFIEVKPFEGTKSDQRRRIVPIKDNLKAFLLPLAKKNGKVIMSAGGEDRPMMGTSKPAT